MAQGLPTKSHILNEIQRCAAANGGRSLGRDRFEVETGIPESAWAGRYWVSWGEAVREAGFEPNELQGKFDGSDILAAPIATTVNVDVADAEDASRTGSFIS